MKRQMIRKTFEAHYSHSAIRCLAEASIESAFMRDFYERFSEGEQVTVTIEKKAPAKRADRRVEKLVSNKVLRKAVSKKAGQG